MMAGLIEIDRGRAQRFAAEHNLVSDDALARLMQEVPIEIECAGREALDDAGQTVVDARAYVDSKRPATVIGSFGFSGDRDGAVAALNGWTDAVARRSPTARMLRRYVHGADLHLEWCDDEYQKELDEGRWWSPSEEETRELVERTKPRSRMRRGGEPR